MSESESRTAHSSAGRLDEIRRRLQAIDAEHRDIDLTAEARAETERLEAEAERLHEHGGTR